MKQFKIYIFGLIAATTTLIFATGYAETKCIPLSEITYTLQNIIAPGPDGCRKDLPNFKEDIHTCYSQTTDLEPGKWFVAAVTFDSDKKCLQNLECKTKLQIRIINAINALKNQQPKQIGNICKYAPTSDNVAISFFTLTER